MPSIRDVQPGDNDLDSELVDLGVAGVEIGHWTDLQARTGCTVVVLPPKTVASAEVRGGAPATRDFALLAPERLVEHVDAIVLTGGSAFGLAACDGVMEVLEAEGRGFETAHGRVPIVVAMALYDLGVGSAAVRPGAAAGRWAASRRAGASPTGRVGAGAGATVNKWLGAAGSSPAGLGVAVVRSGELVVCAITAVNAAGSPDRDGSGSLLDQVTAGSFELSRTHPHPFEPRRLADPETAGARPLENTTLCAVVTNAALTKLDCFWVAQGGQDGLARVLVPAHTRYDGDAVVVAATGTTPCDVDVARILAVAAVTQAVNRAVTPP